MVIKNVKHKYIVSLLVSYILILIIPILISYLYHHQVIKVVKTDIQEYNSVALEQAMKITESRLEEIKNTVYQLTVNSKIKHFIYVSEPFESSSYYKIWEIKNDILPYTLTNDFIVDIAIYFNKSDTVISSYSIYNLESFYNNYIGNHSLPFSGWSQNVLNTYYVNKLLPSMTSVINGKQHETLVYMQTLPISYPGQFDGFIMVMVDKSKVNEILKRAITGNQGFIYIMDEDGNLLAEASKGNVKVVPIHMDSYESGGFTEKRIDGQLMTISYMKSPYNGWLYVVAIPSTILMNKVNYIRNIVIIVTVVSLVVGLSIAYFFARKNTRPLRKIIELLKSSFRDNDNDAGSNEYSFLEGSITWLIKNNQYLQQAVHKQKPVLENVFFNRLMKGEFSSRNEIDSFQSSIDLNIKGRLFAVLLVRIKGYEGLTNEEALKELDASRIIIRDIINTCFINKAYYYFVDRDKIAVLVTYDNNDDTEQFEEYVEYIANEIYNKAWQQYNIQVSFYMGNIYNGLEDVYLSFDEARWVLDYFYDREDEKVISIYSHVPRDNQQYSYSVELETRLMNLVKTGNKAELEKLLDEIYRENYVEKRLKADIKSQLLYEMRGTLIKLSEQLDFFQLFDNRIWAIDCAGDADKAYGEIVELYRSFCDALNNRRSNNVLKLKEKIISYIQENYTDPNLSLASIAHELDMTEQYLSQFFKKYIGQNFSSYLENLRIEYACSLLREHDLSINEIAYKTGYNSDKAFRRAFKRVSGISPTSFRENIKNGMIK